MQRPFVAICKALLLSSPNPAVAVSQVGVGFPAERRLLRESEREVSKRVEQEQSPVACILVHFMNNVRPGAEGQSLTG